MGILQKTFGGLDKAYYFRNLFFALILAGIFVAIQYSGYEMLAKRNVATGVEANAANIVMYIYIAISALLYPYARFVYESIVNFIMGDNVFFINAFVLLAWKFMIMMMLLLFAIFIAPVGLLYLWYYHNKNGTFDELAEQLTSVKYFKEEDFAAGEGVSYALEPATGKIIKTTVTEESGKETVTKEEVTPAEVAEVTVVKLPEDEESASL